MRARAWHGPVTCGRHSASPARTRLYRFFGIDNQFIGEFLATNSRLRGNRFENCPDLRRNTGLIVTKRARKNRRDEQHAAPMPKNMQTGFAKSRGQFLHHRRRRLRFAVPFVLNDLVQYAIVHLPAGRSVDRHFRNRSNESRQIIFLKMALRFGRGGECLRRFFTRRRIGCDFSRFLFPLSRSPPDRSRSESVAGNRRNSFGG